MPDDEWLRRFSAELEAVGANVPRPSRDRPERKHEAAARLKRELLLELLLAGRSLKECVRLAGWNSMQVYYRTREDHPGWAAQVDYTRSRVKDLREGGDVLGGEGTALAFPDFVGRWFPDRRPHLPHQLRIAQTLDELEPRDVVLVLVFPEAGKTATLEDYMCKHLALHPEHRFRYVSEAADLSKRVVGTCARRFTNEEDFGPFIRRYGPFYEKGQERNGRPWTTEQLTLATNPGRERDRNLVATSWTGANYGSRIDTVIFDDLQSQRNYNQAEEIFRRVRGTFFNRGFELRTLIIGTRIGPGDFYDRIRDAGLVTREIIIPAEDPSTGLPTVPEFWSRNTLRHTGGACCSSFRVCPRNKEPLSAKEYMDLVKFQSGSEVWSASYQQNPTASEHLTFAEYIETCLDHDRVYGPTAA